MSKVEALSGKTSVEDILDQVLEFEAETHGLYVDLIPRVTKNIRYLAEDMARDQLGYVRMLSDLKAVPNIRAHLKDAIIAPKADTRFSDCIHAPELPGNPDDQDVLQFAMARVQIAMEEYAELAANAELGLLHEVFNFLANEEAKHKAELEAKYYEIVHSGGV